MYNKMNDQINSNDDLAYSDYVVAYIDIMGQKVLLRQLSIPTNVIEWNQTLSILKETAGVVIGLRKIFDDWFNSLNEPSDIFKNATPNSQRIISEMKRSTLLRRTFSDSFIFATPVLCDNDFCVTINGIYSMIMAISMVTLMSLASKHSIRGGIALGPCITLGDNEIYGSGLERAYTLESNIAEYPRILVDERLVKFLDTVIDSDRKTLFSNFAATQAAEIKNLIKTDSDGQFILDYLHNSVKMLLIDIPKNETDTLYDKMVKFVVASINEFKNDEKLYRRYLMLGEYFQSKGYQVHK